MGAGFLFYLLQWPVAFYGSLVGIAGLPSWILWRRERQSDEGTQNVSPERRQKAFDFLYGGEKNEIVES